MSSARRDVSAGRVKRVGRKPLPAAVPPPVTLPDDAAKARAVRVWRLAVEGASEGERSAGRARAMEMAARAGMNLRAFLIRCGVPKPRVRVKAASRPLPV